MINIEVKTLKVKRIVDLPGRVKLYGEDEDYYVLATTPASNYYIGQIVEYKTFSHNFGIHSISSITPGFGNS